MEINVVIDDPLYPDVVDENGNPIDFTSTEKGGAGSGYFGHAGRPGEVGGSAGGGEAQAGVSASANEWVGKMDQALLDTGAESREENSLYEALGQEHNRIGFISPTGRIFTNDRSTIHYDWALEAYNHAQKNKDFQGISTLYNHGYVRFQGGLENDYFAVMFKWPLSHPVRQAILDYLTAYPNINFSFDIRNSPVNTHSHGLSVAEFFKVMGQSEKGGPGSGYFGHAGRPGEVGGSSPNGRVLAGVDALGEFNQRITSRNENGKISKAKGSDAKTIEKWASKLSSAELASIDGVVICDSDAAFNKTFDEAMQKYNMSLPYDVNQIYAFTDNDDRAKKSIIYLRPLSRESADNFYHEVGHTVLSKSPKKGQWYIAWREPTFDRHTWYSRAGGVAESFAESFGAYIHSGGKVSAAQLHDEKFTGNVAATFEMVSRVVAGLPVSTTKGGPGSGYFGHAGRPGEVGGSVAGGGVIAGVINLVTKAGYHEVTSFENIPEDSRYKFVRLSDGTFIYNSMMGFKNHTFVYSAHILAHPELYSEDQISTADRNIRYDISENEKTETEVMDKEGAISFEGSYWNNEGKNKHVLFIKHNPTDNSSWSNSDEYDKKRAKPVNIALKVFQKMIKKGEFPSTIYDEYIFIGAKLNTHINSAEIEDVVFVDGDGFARMKEISEKGGPGSGYFGHAGRPGKQGGSAASGGIAADRVAGPVENGGRPDVGAGDVVWANSNPSEKSFESKYWDRGHELFESAREGGFLVNTTPMVSWSNPNPKPFEDVPSTIKHFVVNNLASSTGLSQYAVSAVLRSWAKGSQTENALRFQNAVADEFNVPIPRYIERKLISEGILNNYGIDNKYGNDNLTSSDMRKLARKMYDLTQQSLRDMGIGPDDEVTLYRGMKRTTLSAERNKVSVSEKYANGNYKYTGNPIESWTLSMHEARKFGSHQAGMTVKASNIFSTPYSGLGCWGEEEFVIFGSVPGYVATIYS